MAATERGLHVDELKELFYIDEDWNLRWLVHRGRCYCKNSIAGTSHHGYKYVKIKYRQFATHRVIWALHNGEWPNGQMDHINGVRDDNRIENLRIVTNQENQKNTKLSKNNKSGLPGVCWDKAACRWRATAVVNYKAYYLGIYEDFFEAVCARKSAELKYGFHTNHGRK